MCCMVRSSTLQPLPRIAQQSTWAPRPAELCHGHCLASCGGGTWRQQVATWSSFGGLIQLAGRLLLMPSCRPCPFRPLQQSVEAAVCYLELVQALFSWLVTCC